MEIKKQVGNKTNSPNPSFNSDKLKEGKIFKFRLSDIPKGLKEKIPSTIEGMNDILGGGYPNRILIGLVGMPKTGKTTFALREAIGFTQEGFDCLIAFNESNREEYLRQVEMNLKNMGDIDISKVEEHLFLYDVNKIEVNNANFDTINKFTDTFYVDPIVSWLSQHKNARMVVIDSISKIINKYPAQAFVLYQRLSDGIQIFFEKTPIDYKTIIMMIHQKPSDFSSNSENTVFGGLRLIHENSGFIVFSRKKVDTWFARDTGFPVYSFIRLIRAEMRDLNIDGDEHIYGMNNGKIIIGKSIWEMAEERVEEVINE